MLRQEPRLPIGNRRYGTRRGLLGQRQHSFRCAACRRGDERLDRIVVGAIAVHVLPHESRIRRGAAGAQTCRVDRDQAVAERVKDPRGPRRECVRGEDRGARFQFASVIRRAARNTAIRIVRVVDPTVPVRHRHQPLELVPRVTPGTVARAAATGEIVRLAADRRCLDHHRSRVDRVRANLLRRLPLRWLDRCRRCSAKDRTACGVEEIGGAPPLSEVRLAQRLLHPRFRHHPRHRPALTSVDPPSFAFSRRARSS